LLESQLGAASFVEQQQDVGHQAGHTHDLRFVRLKQLQFDIAEVGALGQLAALVFLLLELRKLKDARGEARVHLDFVEVLDWPLTLGQHAHCEFVVVLVVLPGLVVAVPEFLGKLQVVFHGDEFAHAGLADVLLEFADHALLLGVVGALVLDQALRKQVGLLDDELVAPVGAQEEVDHLVQPRVDLVGAHALAGVDHEVVAPLRDPDRGLVVLVHELLEGLHAALLELVLALETLVHYVVDFVLELHQLVHHLHGLLAQVGVVDQQFAALHDLGLEVLRDVLHGQRGLLGEGHLHLLQLVQQFVFEHVLAS